MELRDQKKQHNNCKEVKSCKTSSIGKSHHILLPFSRKYLVTYILMELWLTFGRRSSWSFFHPRIIDIIVLWSIVHQSSLLAADNTIIDHIHCFAILVVVVVLLFVVTSSGGFFQMDHKCVPSPKRQ